MRPEFLHALRPLLASAVLCALAIDTASAQSATASIRGTVKAGEQVIPDASIVVVNSGSGFKYAATTDAAGNF